MVYDAGKAFKRIEQELIDSMMINMKNHRLEEDATGLEWEQWQAVQLQELEKYKRRNAKRYPKQFDKINDNIKNAIIKAKATGKMQEEIAILEALKKGFVTPKRPKNLSGSFFRVNERKMNALLEAVEHDMKKAEYAVLRHVDDQYRQIIFQSQVYANSGAGTYEKAVDMASKDFLQRGINCVEYKNGARVNIADYASMAIRTSTKRAYLQGEGEKRNEWGISTVIMNKRGNACPKCIPFEGKILIDDVWSGGSADDGPYPLMSAAISAGLYHPNCKDVHSTFFPGVSPEPEKTFTKKELEDVEERQRLENKAQHAKRQEQRFARLSQFSLDEDNVQNYTAKKAEWENNKNRTYQRLKAFEEEKGFVLEGLENRIYKNSANEMDLMARSKLFAVGDDIRVRAKRVSGTEYDFWAQDSTKKIRQTIENVERILPELSEYKMPRIIFVKKSKIPGLAGYDYKQDILFISDELHSEEYFKNTLSNNYFAAKSIKDTLIHELTHKQHWDSAKEFYKVNKKSYNNLEEAMKSLNSPLTSYVKRQVLYDLTYVLRVSRNAGDAFSIGNIKELVAEVAVLKNEIEDVELYKKVKEVLSWK